MLWTFPTTLANFLLLIPYRPRNAGQRTQKRMVLIAAKPSLTRTRCPWPASKGNMLTPTPPPNWKHMSKSKDLTKTVWEANAYNSALGGIWGGRAEVPLLTPQYFCPRSKRVEVPGGTDSRSQVQVTWNLNWRGQKRLVCYAFSITGTLLLGSDVRGHWNESWSYQPT